MEETAKSIAGIIKTFLIMYSSNGYLIVWHIMA